MAIRKRRERRERAFWVDQNIVLELIQRRWDLPNYLRAWTPANVPDDVVVERVIYDPENRGFAFVLSHHSWDDVPDGERTPDGGCLCVDSIMIQIRKTPEPETSYCHPFVDAYPSLVEENRILRGILSDATQDDARLALSHEEGYRQGLREAGRLRFDERGVLLSTHASQEDIQRVQEAMASYVGPLMVLPSGPDYQIFGPGEQAVIVPPVGPPVLEPAVGQESRWDGEILVNAPYVWVDDRGMRTVYVVRHGHDFIRLRDDQGNEYDVDESRFREACRPMLARRREAD